MREVQAIIFDLDDTLWEVGPVIVRAEHAMLAFLAPEKPYWAVPLPIALMGLGLVLYYRLSVAADASDTTTRHGG